MYETIMRHESNVNSQLAKPINDIDVAVDRLKKLTKEEWLSRVINVSLPDEIPHLRMYDLDNTLFKNGFGNWDSREKKEVLKYCDDRNEGVKVSCPRYFIDNIPDDILVALKGQYDNGDKLFIVSYNGSGNRLIYSVLKDRCEHNELFGQLFDDNKVFCFIEPSMILTEEDQSKFNKWASRYGKNIHILMAVLSYFEELAMIEPNQEETYEWKYQFAKEILSKKCDSKEIDETSKFQDDFLQKLLIFVQKEKITLYDDDRINCSLAKDVIGIQNVLIEDFNLAAILNLLDSDTKVLGKRNRASIEMLCSGTSESSFFSPLPPAKRTVSDEVSHNSQLYCNETLEF